MGAVGKFIHSAGGATQGAAMGTSFDADKRVDFALGTGARFAGRLSAIYFDGTIDSSATKLTIKVYNDTAGTGNLIVPETECTLTLDISGAGGGAVVELELDLLLTGSTTLSMFGKTDTGTFLVTSAQLVWEE
mgnify:CR=1 FL=1